MEWGILKFATVVIVYSIVLAQPLVAENSDSGSATITDDAIIVEAFQSTQNQKSKRNVKTYLRQPYIVDTLDSNAHFNPCITNKGTLGRCMSATSCFQPNEIQKLNDWQTGIPVYCNYFTSQGLQNSGICCSNTQTESSIENNDKQIGPIHGAPLLANWPPPLPTHPPNHTIPPLPTHPPSPGYPFVTQPTTMEPVSTTVPTWQKPTTQSPWQKPTTQYPWQKPTTTSSPWQKPTTMRTTTVSTPVISTASCGAKNGYQDQERIVGGHNADIGEWPWIAALFNNGRQFCGGSLIDSVHILSAAHCIAHMNSWDVARLTVRLGDYNIKTPSEIRHIEKKVKRVVRHKGFDSRTLYNDISIITIDSPVSFTQQISPICLPSGGDKFIGKTATVIGWGSLRESGPQPAVLQEVNIPIWSNNDCRSKYGHAAPGGIVEHMLCAGQANRDSCSGDSGGPLMVNNGKWTQIGIVSWGIGCGKGQYPGVYTRVTNFLPWITKNLK